MKRPRLFSCLTALAALLCALPATAQQVVPHRVIAEPGDMAGIWVAESPNGRFLLLVSSQEDSLMIFDKQTQRRWSLGARGNIGVFSPQGDRIAFVLAEQDKTHVWTLPIDPATGRAAGHAQRVTLTPGANVPSFSPDGRTIAFQRAGDLYAVPSVGGEERLVVDEAFPVMRPFFGPDGEWIYFRAAEAPAAPWIRRVRATGGASERVLQAAQPLGISPSGKYLAYYHTYIPYQADDATIGIATIDGKEVARARMPFISYWGRWAAGDRFVFAALDVPVGLNRIRLADGALTQLTAKTAYDGAPAYSPDGRYIASHRRIGNESHLALLRPDGSLERMLQTSPVLGRTAHLWSPNGQHIAYLTLGRALAVVNVANGRETVLAPNTGLVNTRFAWRDDGRALRFIDSSDLQSRAVREVTLDGAAKTLLRLDSTQIRQTQINFLDDHNIVLTRPGKISVQPLAGGAARVVLDREHAAAQGVAVSPDRKWLSVPIPIATGGETLAIVSTAGGAPRMLSFTQPCGVSPGVWHPDGRHLLVNSNTNCTGRFDIHLVPLDGGPARNLTAVDKQAVDTNSLTISPDGKYMIYDSEAGWLTKIAEIDVPAWLGARANR